MTKKYLSIIISVVLIACVMASCVAGGNNENEGVTLVTQTTTEKVQDTTSFKLSYSQSDSLNPYQSTTLNNQVLQTLVYESLFAVNTNYEAESVLATGFVYKDATTLSVTIPSGLLFSDGTKITTGDVVNSFYNAKASPHWQNSLAYISSAAAIDDTTIDFYLSQPQAMAQNLLTFAIAKSEPDAKGYYIGSGRYAFNEGDGQVFIEVNKNKEGFDPYFTKIILVNITAPESIRNAVNIGNISWTYLDLADGDQTRMTCGKKAVNLNNMVYIGINNTYSITADANIRKAISLAVDRETLVKSAYQGRANCATSVFNPVSPIGKETAIFSKSANTAAAKQAIAQSGYDQNKLNLTILTNENSNKVATAQLVKQQLEAVGFSVSVNVQSNESYQAMVASKSFDIYIGETKIPNNMSLNSFFAQGGATSYGINLENSKAAGAYNGYLYEQAEIGNFVLEFSEEMPFVPLVYRQGLICYSKSIQGDIQGSYENYFANIEDWHY